MKKCKKIRLQEQLGYITYRISFIHDMTKREGLLGFFFFLEKKKLCSDLSFLRQTGNQDMVFTQIVPQHPGYVWSWDVEACMWELTWEPVPGVYSPPVLHSHLWWNQLDVPDNCRDLCGRVIGKQGYFLKRITEASRALYIFLHGSRFEIWGLSSEGVARARDMVWRRIQVQKLNRVGLPCNC